MIHLTLFHRFILKIEDRHRYENILRTFFIKLLYICIGEGGFFFLICSLLFYIKIEKHKTIIIEGKEY